MGVAASLDGEDLGLGWAILAEAGPTGQAGFAVILLTCLLLALRGSVPGAPLMALLGLARRR